MKDKYEGKVWWNWLHFIILILGIIYGILNMGYGCVYGSSWGDCFSQRINMPISWLGVILLIILLYFVSILISWIYYINKTRKK